MDKCEEERQQKRDEEIQEIMSELEEDTKNQKNYFAGIREKLNATRELLGGVLDDMTFWTNFDNLYKTHILQIFLIFLIGIH